MSGFTLRLLKIEGLGMFGCSSSSLFLYRNLALIHQFSKILKHVVAFNHINNPLAGMWPKFKLPRSTRELSQFRSSVPAMEMMQTVTPIQELGLQLQVIIKYNI